MINNTAFARTLHAKPNCLNELMAHMEMGQHTNIVVMNFSKVNHSTLFHKLHHNVSRNTLNLWMFSFITNQKLAVVVDKCSVLTVNHKLTTSKHKYSLHDHVLENASSAKYLGVTLQHNTQFNQHIDTVVAKVNRTVGC